MKLRFVKSTVVLAGIAFFGQIGNAQSLDSVEKVLKTALSPFECTSTVDKWQITRHSCEVIGQSHKKFEFDVRGSSTSPNFDYQIEFRFTENMSIEDFLKPLSELSDGLFGAPANWPETGGRVYCFSENGSIRRPQFSKEALRIDTYVSATPQVQMSMYIEYFEKSFRLHQCVIA